MEDTADFHKKLDADQLHAKCISGDIFSETAAVDGPTIKVKTLLGPLAAGDVPLVKGIGLNYLAHSKWSHMNQLTYHGLLISYSE